MKAEKSTEETKFAMSFHVLFSLISVPVFLLAGAEQ